MKNQVTSPQIISSALAKRMLIGAIIGLAIISIFIFNVPDPRPEWGALWRVRPLIITPLAGAICGACYHVINALLYQTSQRKILAVVLGVLVYIVGLWLGTVLGLDGTLWD